jgi:hypothetical protein
MRNLVDIIVSESGTVAESQQLQPIDDALSASIAGSVNKSTSKIPSQSSVMGSVRDSIVPILPATREQYVLCMWLQKLPDNHGQVNSVYFVRSQAGVIPIPKNSFDADNTLPKWLEIGYFSGHALNMLEQAISEVYLPLLCNLELVDKPSGAADDKKGHEFKADFVATMQKFASQISHTSQQIVCDKCNLIIGW